jgi:hypothetical protein
MLYGPAGNARVTLLCACYVRWGMLSAQDAGAGTDPRRRTSGNADESERVRSNG